MFFFIAVVVVVVVLISSNRYFILKHNAFANISLEVCYQYTVYVCLYYLTTTDVFLNKQTDSTPIIIIQKKHTKKNSNKKLLTLHLINSSRNENIIDLETKIKKHTHTKKPWVHALKSKQWKTTIAQAAAAAVTVTITITTTKNNSMY